MWDSGLLEHMNLTASPLGHQKLEIVSAKMQNVNM
jgi:hypothetical protein